jgi:oxygen-independent coproporphyrinogen-3 oxidase
MEGATPLSLLRNSGGFRKPDDDSCADLYFLAHEILTGAGYDHYEVSSYALGNEYRSEHNSSYWDRTPYTGLGPSSHSFDGVSRRWWNTPDVMRYLELVECGVSPVQGSEILTPHQQVYEMIMLGMRFSDGFDTDRFKALGVVTNPGWQAIIERLQKEGHIELDDSLVRPTATGMLLADGIALELSGHLTPETED